MKSLVTADLHLTANPRDRYRHETLRRLVTTAKKLGVEQTFILGDLTEEKDRHGDWLTNAVVDHITRFAELGPVTINQGNHDYSSDPDMPFFRFLRHLPSVRWIGRPTSCTYPGLGRVLLLPHTRSYKRDWEGVERKGYAYVFAHSTFDTTDLGHGRKAQGIPPEVFKGERVITGDVHIPQTILIPSSPKHVSGSITYVGAPYTVDFGDDYNPRVIILDQQKLTSVPVPGPQKRLIELEPETHEEPWQEGIDEVNKGDIVKIRVKVPRRSAPLWPAQRDELRKFWEKQGVVVHSITPVIAEELGRRVKIKARDQKDDEEVLTEFGKHRGVDKGTLTIGRKML